MAKTKKKSIDADALVALGATVPTSLKNRIREIAKAEDRPFQRVVRRALQEYADGRTAKVAS